MTTLTITLDEKLSRQIVEAAQAQGTDADKIAISVLQQAFGKSAPASPNAPQQVAATNPMAEQFLASLAPVWAEHRQSSAAKVCEREEEAGDAYEAKLARYYAEDYDRAQGRRP